MGKQTLPKFNILLLGNSGVGKTCLFNRYRSGSFSNEMTASVGLDLFSKSFEIGDEPVKFVFRDTAGQERYHSLLPKYYRLAYGAIIVYDVTNSASFQELSYWLKELEYYCGTQHMKKIIVGNKTDMEGREVSSKSAKEFALKNGVSYMETSAKDDANIEIAFEYLVQQVLLCPDLWQELNLTELVTEAVLQLFEGSKLSKRFCIC